MTLTCVPKASRVRPCRVICPRSDYLARNRGAFIGRCINELHHRLIQNVMDFHATLAERGHRDSLDRWWAMIEEHPTCQLYRDLDAGLYGAFVRDEEVVSKVRDGHA